MPRAAAGPQSLILVTIVAALSACADVTATHDHGATPPDSASQPVSRARLVIVSGDSQSAPLNAPVPLLLQVRAIDALGNPVPSVAVRFSNASGRGEISGSGALTDTSGVAVSGAWTLGSVAGRQFVIAWAQGYEQVIFTAFAQTPPPTDPGGQPAGERLVYVRDGAIWQATDSEALLLLKPEGEIQTADVSRNGSIAFVAGPTNRVCVAESGSSEPRCSSTGYYNISGLAWSPDGSHIVFSGQPALSSCPSTPPCYLAQADLLALDAATMSVRPVAANVPRGFALGASWSPDGSAIAFAAAGGVWLVNADGSELRELKARVGGPYAVKAVRWSPDGRKLSLNLSDESMCDWDCATAIGTMSLDGSELRMVATGSVAGYEFVGTWPHGAPVWSPDGQKIAFGYSDCSHGFGIPGDPCRESVSVASASGGASQPLLQNATLLAWHER